MPKTKGTPKEKPGGPGTTSTEALGYVGGLYREFREQVCRYNQLTGELLSMQARVELQEKNLVVTREHLAFAIEKSEEQLPPLWTEQITYARFVGMRLADACLVLLKERKRLTHAEILTALNKGMFRFRTNAPLREIHGAMVRQPFVRRVSDGWMWTGPDVIDPEQGPPAPRATDGDPALRLVPKATAVNGAGPDKATPQGT
jgi:hypothetical protein